MRQSLRASAVVAACAILAATVPGVARASEWLSGTNSAELAYHASNEDHLPTNDEYTSFVNRLNLGSKYKDLELNLRLDAGLFSPHPDSAATASFDAADDATFRNHVMLERALASYTIGDFQLRAGDEYRQLGRGILLSLRRIDEAGVDLAIRGGSATFTHGGVTATAFGGTTVSAPLDSATQAFIEDPEDRILGGLVAYQHETVGTFTGMGEQIRVESPALPIPGALHPTVTAFGASWEAPASDNVALYVEADSVQSSTLDDRGTGAFASATFYLGDYTVSAEGLFLEATALDASGNTATPGKPFRYSLPPTLERFDQEVLEYDNVRGGRVRLEWISPDSGLVLYANEMVRLPNYGEPSAGRQFHQYAGFEYPYDDGASHINASVGYRYESARANGAWDQSLSMPHGEADLLQSLGGKLALHINGNLELRDSGAIDRVYQRSNSVWGLDRHGWGGVALEVGYDDEKADLPSWYFAGHLTVDTGKLWSVRAVAGTERGGLKCVGGMCREFPAFAGARVELVTRF